MHYLRLHGWFHSWATQQNIPSSALQFVTQSHPKKLQGHSRRSLQNWRNMEQWVYRAIWIVTVRNHLEHCNFFQLNEIYIVYSSGFQLFLIQKMNKNICDHPFRPTVIKNEKVYRNTMIYVTEKLIGSIWSTRLCRLHLLIKVRSHVLTFSQDTAGFHWAIYWLKPHWFICSTELAFRHWSTFATKTLTLHYVIEASRLI